MKRMLALMGAVVMIAVAVVIRSSLDGDGTPGPSSSGPLTIACVTELEVQCRALPNVNVRIEDAATTARALADGKADIDGWVTFDPWPEIVDALAPGGDAVGDSTRIARSALVIATVKERQDVFGCTSWRCLGEAIGQPWTAVGGKQEWGTVKVALPPPTTGLGLLMLGNAVSGFFGRSDIATNDFDTDPDFAVWRANVTVSVARAAFTTVVQQFPAAFSYVAVTDVERRTAVRGDIGTLTPQPAASADVVVAPVDGGRVAGIRGDLQKRLRDAGWSTDGLNEATGLPNAGVLLALSGLTR
jgi:hypothetical protein